MGHPALQVRALRQLAFQSALRRHRPAVAKRLLARGEDYVHVRQTVGAQSGALTAPSAALGGTAAAAAAAAVANGTLPPVASTSALVGRWPPLIVGIFESLPASAGLLAFLASLRRVLPPAAADVLILSESGRVGEGVGAACASHGARLHTFEQREYVWVRQGAEVPRRSKRWNDRLRKAIKFAVARDLLRQWQQQARGPPSGEGSSLAGGLALLVDVSDVVFQARSPLISRALARTPMLSPVLHDLNMISY